MMPFSLRCLTSFVLILSLLFNPGTAFSAKIATPVAPRIQPPAPGGALSLSQLLGEEAFHLAAGTAYRPALERLENEFAQFAEEEGLDLAELVREEEISIETLRKHLAPHIQEVLAEARTVLEIKKERETRDEPDQRTTADPSQMEERDLRTIQRLERLRMISGLLEKDDAARILETHWTLGFSMTDSLAQGKAPPVDTGAGVSPPRGSPSKNTSPEEIAFSNFRESLGPRRDVSPSKRYWIIPKEHGIVTLYDARKGTGVELDFPDKISQNGVKFSSDERFLLLRGPQRTGLFDLKHGGKQLFDIPGTMSNAYVFGDYLRLVPEGPGPSLLFSVSTGKKLSLPRNATSLRTTPFQGWLLLTTEGERYLFNPETEKAIPLGISEPGVGYPFLSKDLRFIFHLKTTQTRSGAKTTLFLVDRKKAKETFIRDSYFNAVRLSQDGSRAYLFDPGNSVFGVVLEKAEPFEIFPDRGTVVLHELNRYGRGAYLKFADGSAVLFYPETGKHIELPRTEDAPSLEGSGKKTLLRFETGELWIADEEALSLSRLHPNVPGVRNAKLSPNGDYALLEVETEFDRVWKNGGANGAMIALMRISDGEIIPVPVPRSYHLQGFSFSGDGQSLVMNDSHGVANLDIAFLESLSKSSLFPRGWQSGMLAFRLLSKLVETGIVDSAKALRNVAENSAETIARLYATGELPIGTSRIEFRDGGDSENNHRNVLLDLVGLAQPRGKKPERHLRRVADGSVRLKKIPTLESLLEAFPGAVYHRTYGRTVELRKDGKAIHIKLLKKDEDPAVLLRGYEHNRFFRSKKKAWGLRGLYPKGKIALARISKGEVPKTFLSGLVGKEPEIELEEDSGDYILTAYEVPLDGKNNPYTTYLNQPDVDPETFREALRINIHDRLVMARHGFFDLEIIELFHNQDGEDARMYDWMIDAHNVRQGRQGAGRLNDVVGATRFPNARVSGPADLDGIVHLDELLEQKRYWERWDGRIQRLHLLAGYDMDETRAYLETALLGDTLFSHGLLIPTYLSNRGELDVETELGSKTFLQTVLREDLFKTVHESFDPPGDFPFRDSVMKYDQMALQMATFMTEHYVTLLEHGKMPGAIFPGTEIEITDGLYESRGYRPWQGFDLMGNQHRMPFPGKPEVPSYDLGFVNGANPLIAFIRGIYLSTTFLQTQTTSPNPPN